MKNLQHTRSRGSIVARVLAASAMPVALLATASGAATAPPANPIQLNAPSGLPGTALPYSGVTASTFTASNNFLKLTTSPNAGVSGTPLTVSGSGLSANTTLQLTWGTNSATWSVDPEPYTVDYLGSNYSPTSATSLLNSSNSMYVNMATVTTDANGAFTLKAKAPTDFGGNHDIWAVSSGVGVANGSFDMLRKVTISPSSGPVGTPITITYTSMDANPYGGGGSVLWDNHYAGEIMGNWTRGTASVTIRAAGAVGTHFIQVGDAISFLYMNPIQSPITDDNGGVRAFRVTASNVLPKPSLTFPTKVTPNVSASQYTTMYNSALGAKVFQPSALDPTSSAVATLSPNSGPVGSKTKLHVSGLSASVTGNLELDLVTVTGSRVNCVGTCWGYNYTSLGTATASNGTLDQTVTIPNNPGVNTLGGWHAIVVVQGPMNTDAAGNRAPAPGSLIESQVPFYVKESIKPFYNKAGKLLSMGVATAKDTAALANEVGGQVGSGTYTFKEGQEFTISILGVGWTQLDNTLAVDYDNSYIGYGCGFHSNGYMAVHLTATGGPGIHIIDLYPLLYSVSPNLATYYGMVPLLSANHDDPGLALGYQIPSIHFAIRIVK
ncbi:MAG: hypothetical protein HKL86_00635 [Acidimicrobiaceae bacterium]|nr:hypothetical protein [Acidimicrobiaceae bacterium]